MSPSRAGIVIEPLRRIRAATASRSTPRVAVARVATWPRQAARAPPIHASLSSSVVIAPYRLVRALASRPP